MDKFEFEFMKLLENHDQFVRIPAGSVLFREGDAGDNMYIILEGEISLTINGQALGQELEGGVVGEMALIDESSRSATATTRTDCLLAPLDIEAFTELVRKKPEFAIQVMRVLSQRLRLANEILTLF